MADFPQSIPDFDDLTASASLAQNHHTARHNKVHAELAALAVKIGVDNSDDPDSIDYKLRHLAITKEDLGLDQVDNTSDVNKPLSTAQKAYVDAKALGSNSFVFNEIPTGSINGSNLSFQTVNPYVALTTDLYLNGLHQDYGVDYFETTPGSGIITFAVAPFTGDSVRIGYQFTPTSTTSNADTVDGKHAAELSQVGDIIMSMRTTPGANRLFMSGGTYNKADWPALWSLNTSHPAYFTASTTLTFTLADMRQRVPVGKDASTFATLGNRGGAETNTHNHWQTFSYDGGGLYGTTTGQSPRSRVVGIPHGIPVSTGSAGGNTREDSTYDETISVLQPYIVVNYEVIAA